MTLDEKQTLDPALKILKLALSVSRNERPLYWDSVHPDKLREWIDLFASESSDPGGALAVIRKSIPSFEPSRYLAQAIAEHEAEVALSDA